MTKNKLKKEKKYFVFIYLKNLPQILKPTEVFLPKFSVSRNCQHKEKGSSQGEKVPQNPQKVQVEIFGRESLKLSPKKKGGKKVEISINFNHKLK